MSNQGNKPPGGGSKTIMQWQAPVVPQAQPQAQPPAAGQPPAPAYPPPAAPAAPQQPGGFPPQQAGGFPPQQPGGFPPQQPGGFPPQQPGGFPPQQPQPGFPPQQPAGMQPPPQAGGFPPQQPQPGGFPPQQPGGFPPQQPQPGFPPQQAGGFPPQQPQPGFPPQQQPQGMGQPPGMGQPQGMGQPPGMGQPQQQGGGLGNAAAIGMGAAMGGAAAHQPAWAGGGGGQAQPQAAMGGGGVSQGRPIPQADATAGVSPRTQFIRLTYIHLFGAICLFAAVEWVLMKKDFVVFKKVSVPILEFALLGPRWHWAVVLAAFMVVGYIADYWARSNTSRALQYFGLGLYAVAEAVIFLPLLFLAELKGMEIMAKNGGTEVHIIRDAAFITIALFGVLTASVLVTKKDFSFMRTGLAVGSAAAMGLIMMSIFFGFNLGLVFSFAMVILAAGYILYYTSQVLAHYHPGQHVAAALALFSAVALMFWYVIRILMKLRD